jgi:guanine nucleotide-binding protein G(i) subunit alpha
MRRILLNPRVVKVLENHRNALKLHDSWFYLAKRFMNDLNFGTEVWVPNNDDVMSLYVRTSGIVQYRLEKSNSPSSHNLIHLHICDTGGQRCERKKWSHIYSALNAIFYVASLAEYDEVLYEDPEKNRLEESLEVFESICNNPEFADVPIFLLLSKEDLLRTKLKDKPIPLNISGKFPDAPDADAGFEASLKWIQNKYHARTGSHKVTTKIVNCIDRKDVKEFMESFQQKMCDRMKKQ